MNFKTQYRFSDCRDVLPLPFDFFIESKNLLIEFDGIQHFNPKKTFNKNFEKIQEHDRIKNEYARSHNIKLLRIPYYEKDIYKVLQEALQ